MASFIVKQIVGKKLESVKGAVGGGDKKEEGAGGEKKDGAAGEDPELVQQRLEEEERRREKHRKAEAEREAVRQQIRDKYGIKKKQTMSTMEDPNRAGQIGRKRKTPEELAAEARKEGEEDEGFLPSKLTEAPSQLVSQVTGKCLVM